MYKFGDKSIWNLENLSTLPRIAFVFVWCTFILHDNCFNAGRCALPWNGHSFHINHDQTWPLRISTKLDFNQTKPHKLHEFLYSNYTHNRQHLASDACACADRSRSVVLVNEFMYTIWLKSAGFMSGRDRYKIDGNEPILNTLERRSDICVYLTYRAGCNGEV